MRNWSFPLGGFRGIRVECHLSLLLLFVAVAAQAWMQAGWPGVLWGAALFVGLFLCVVLHEFGHALVAVRHGVRVHRILLLPFGGMAQMDHVPANPREELAITLAGPAVNFGIFGVFVLAMGFDWSWFRDGFPTSFRGLLEALAAVNLLMGAFNLLPIFPMDGGRVVRAVLALRYSHFHSTRAAVYLGRALATAGVVVALYERQLLPALLFAFIFVGGELEYRSVVRRRRVHGLQVADLIRRKVLQLPANATVSDALDAVARNRPQDILLMDEGRPVAAVSLDRLRAAVRADCMSDPLLDIAYRPLTILHADWPLEPFVDTIDSSGQPLFPVYHRGVLLGVIEARGATESLRWITAIREVRGELDRI